MTLLEEATIEIAALLDELRLQYMVIGAAAAGFWGEARATLDVDITIWVEPGQLEATIEEFASRLALRTAKPIETVQRLRLLPVRAKNGVPVDLLFAKWPLEKQALDRAISRTSEISECGSHRWTICCSLS